MESYQLNHDKCENRADERIEAVSRDQNSGPVSVIFPENTSASSWEFQQIVPIMLDGDQPSQI